LNFLSFRLESPIYAPKILVYAGFHSQSAWAHCSDTKKAHTCGISRLLRYRA